MKNLNLETNMIAEAYNICGIEGRATVDASNNLIVDLYTAVNQVSDNLLKEVDALCGPNAGNMPTNIQAVIVNLRHASDTAVDELIAEMQRRANKVELQDVGIDVDNDVPQQFTTDPMF